MNDINTSLASALATTTLETGATHHVITAFSTALLAVNDGVMAVDEAYDSFDPVVADKISDDVIAAGHLIVALAKMIDEITGTPAHTVLVALHDAVSGMTAR